MTIQEFERLNDFKKNFHKMHKEFLFLSKNVVDWVFFWRKEIEMSIDFIDHFSAHMFKWINKFDEEEIIESINNMQKGLILLIKSLPKC